MCEFSEDPWYAAPRAILPCRVFLASFNGRFVVLVNDVLGRLGRAYPTGVRRVVVGSYREVATMREAVSHEKHMLRVNWMLPGLLAE